MERENRNMKIASRGIKSKGMDLWKPKKQ